MTSVILYFCCTNTKGQVYADICNNISEAEQIMIIKFCEILSTMEVTINNVKAAIEGAFTSTHEGLKKERKFDETDSNLTECDNSGYTLPKIKNNTEAKIQFKSSITVLPSVVNESSRSLVLSDESHANDYFIGHTIGTETDGQDIKESWKELSIQDRSSLNQFCQPDCLCTRCSQNGPCCGDPGCTKELCDDVKNKNIGHFFTKMLADDRRNEKIGSHIRQWIYITIIGFIILLAFIIFLTTIPFWVDKNRSSVTITEKNIKRRQETINSYWQCKNKFCERVFNPLLNASTYDSLSQCTLLCTGPQIWPLPTGYTNFSKTIVALSTKKMEYKQSIPSDDVRQNLAEAFKLFIKDIAKMEQNSLTLRQRQNISVKKLIIHIDIDGDTDARLRLNTDESYILKINLFNDILIKISSVSFCGARHGLETLYQVLLFDESTGYIITLSNILIHDSPVYKYRGLMVDTVNNYLPPSFLIRTIDAMSFNKLNTFHWRVDLTSFPVENNIYQYGSCDKSMVYTKKDIIHLVKRAAVRGIRVLIEVAVPGAIGSPRNWLNQSPCSKTNLTNPVSLQKIFELLRKIYLIILEITKVDDVFHLGGNIFPQNNCYGIKYIDFLDKTIELLKFANKGFLPKLPIIWHEGVLGHFDQTWPRFGVQYKDFTNSNLSKYKVIQSTKWDLSCEIKNQKCIKYRTWQQMYTWMSWRNIEAFTIEGGEALLWTDLVDSSNLEYHLWPRAATVAERLWSDVVASSSADNTVYIRLDMQRSRMLRRGVSVQPIWPAWCSFNPTKCLVYVH